MNQLLAAGLELMLVGMGTVFVFLTLLVGATVVMSRIVMRFPTPPRPALPPAPAEPAVDPGEEDIAVISAAIVAHRSINKE